MGFLTRALVPRGVRRAAHPARTVRRAVTPRPVKQAQRALHPVSNIIYDMERSLNTKPRTRKAPRQASQQQQQVVVNVADVAAWYEARYNRGSISSVTCRQDPANQCALIATGVVTNSKGLTSRLSARITINPDGSWQVA
jgi:hypothetical protein